MSGRAWLSRFIYGGPSNIAVNDFLRAYVVSRLHGDESVYADCGSLGVVRDGKVIGAVLFHNWQPEYGTIELSAAADNPRWLSRTAINEIMNICFSQCGCQTLYTRQAADNTRAVKIYRFLGFKEILLPHMRGKDKHEIVMMMTAAEWRGHPLNEVKNGQTQSTENA